MHVLLFSLYFEVPIFFMTMLFLTDESLDLNKIFLFLLLQMLTAAIMLLDLLLELITIGLLALAVPLCVVLEVGNAGGC